MMPNSIAPVTASTINGPGSVNRRRNDLLFDIG